MTVGTKLKIPFDLQLSAISVFLCLTGIACDSTDAVVSYGPVGSPVAISWNSAGQISIDAQKRIVTPVGVFEIGSSTRLHDDENHTVLVIQDRRTGTEQIFRIKNGDELTLEQTTAAIRFDGKRIVVDISDGSPNTIRLSGHGSQINSFSQGTSTGQSTTGPFDLSGRWMSSLGDIYVLNDSGTELSLALESSPNISSARGRLIKRGSNLTGSISGIFHDDRSMSVRRSDIDGTVLNPNTLELQIDFIRWNAHGMEVGRSRRSIGFTKID